MNLQNDRSCVALATAYRTINYGSVLQAFALQHALDDMGVQNEIIPMQGVMGKISINRKRFYLRHILDLPLYLNKVERVECLVHKKVNKELNRLSNQRKAKFDDFIKKNLRFFSGSVDSFGQLSEMCKKYDAVITGSDQIWTPANVYGGFYSLSFVPDGVRRVSYAASFGISNIWRSDRRIYREFLTKMDHISVREKDGVRLVKDLSRKDAEFVCDPTILMNKDEWRSAIGRSSVKRPDKYIFCYFLGGSSLPRDFTRKLKELTSLPIVCINHLDVYVAGDENFGDLAPYDVGPAEFVDLIENASYICTDSFHGTVMSLIFNKVFFSFHRHQNSDKYSTNSRLDSLLSIVGHPERLIEELPETIEKEWLQIDYAEVDARLEELRSSSKQFLRKALE